MRNSFRRLSDILSDNVIKTTGFFKERKKTFIVLFFAAYFLLGLFIYDDYGTYGDDIVNRNNGLMSYRYVFEKDDSLLTYRDRYYGTAFEIVLIFLEKGMALSDPRDILLMRHFATFFFNWVGLLFLFFILRTHFRSDLLAIMGCSMMILSPRIFADSFYNSKDTGFMVLYVVCAYTLLSYLEEGTFRRALLHGLASAALVGVRVVGILMPALTVGFLMLDAVTGRKKLGKRNVYTLLVYLSVMAGFLVLIWPILWGDPIGRVIQAFRYMKLYPWDGTNLYFGKYISAGSLPWHYTLSWILVTTPLSYVAFSIAGIVFVVRRFFRSPAGLYRDGWREIVFFSLFAAPIVLVILLRPVLYDGWRHMFYVYPFLVVYACIGVDLIFKNVNDYGKTFLRRSVKIGTILVLLVSFVFTAGIMVEQHPHQNVYFNLIPGGMERARENFEMDYWGLSFKKGFEYIAAREESKDIPVCVSLLPGILGKMSALILEKDVRERFSFVSSPEEARYFLTNFRWHTADYEFGEEVFSVKVGGAKIMSVYRMGIE